MKDKIKKILQDYQLTDLTLNDAAQQVLYLFSVSGSAVCPYCNGDGWTAEHDLHPHPDGDCMGMCPIQVQCQHCEATGKVMQEVLDRYNENKMELYTKDTDNFLYKELNKPSQDNSD